MCAASAAVPPPVTGPLLLYVSLFKSKVISMWGFMEFERKVPQTFAFGSAQVAPVMLNGDGMQDATTGVQRSLQAFSPSVCFLYPSVEHAVRTCTNLNWSLNNNSHMEVENSILFPKYCVMLNNFLKLSTYSICCGSLCVSWWKLCRRIDSWAVTVSLFF